MSQLSITIRAATPPDLPLILSFIQQKAEFDRASKPIAATIETLEQTLFCQSPKAQVLLAEIETKSVGFALLYFSYSSFLAQSGLWLEDLFVQSSWRGQGVGTALLKHLATLAEAHQCGRIEWMVNVNNQPAIAFYQQQGAHIVVDRKLCRLDRAFHSLLTKTSNPLQYPI